MQIRFNYKTIVWVPNITILIKDKLYEDLSDSDSPSNIYYVLCEDNKRRWVNKDYFITISEHRDKLINEIINETSI